MTPTHSFFNPLTFTFTECGGKFTTSYGVIQSPLYAEKNYPKNVVCQWIIELPSPEFKIRLEFMGFQLENSRSCQYDFVLVMDGPPSLPTALGKFCGNSSQDLVSKSNVMTILFKSDATKTDKGFEAYWSAVRGLAIPSPTPSTKIPSSKINTSKFIFRESYLPSFVYWLKNLTCFYSGIWSYYRLRENQQGSPQVVPPSKWNQQEPASGPAHIDAFSLLHIVHATAIENDDINGFKRDEFYKCSYL